MDSAGLVCTRLVAFLTIRSPIIKSAWYMLDVQILIVLNSKLPVDECQYLGLWSQVLAFSHTQSPHKTQVSEDTGAWAHSLVDNMELQSFWSIQCVTVRTNDMLVWLTFIRSPRHTIINVHIATAGKHIHTHSKYYDSTYYRCYSALCIRTYLDSTTRDQTHLAAPQNVSSIDPLPGQPVRVLVL